MRVFIDKLGSHHGPTPGVEHNSTEPGYFGTNTLLKYGAKHCTLATVESNERCIYI